MQISIVMAQTLDGKIGRNSGHIANWTSTEDKKAFASKTKELGVSIMGSATFDTIGRALPGRLNLILTSRPQAYQDKVQPGVLEFFQGTPEQTVTMLEQRGYQTAALGGGAKTNAAFLKAGLVDEIFLTIEPLIFGSGISIAEGIELDLKLQLLDSTMLNDTAIQLHYKIIK